MRHRQQVEGKKQVSNNVIFLDVPTKLDIDPRRVLEAALDAEMKGVVVIGWSKDGSFYGASSIANGGDVLWLTELLKQRLLGSNS